MDASYLFMIVVILLAGRGISKVLSATGDNPAKYEKAVGLLGSLWKKR